MTWFGWPARGQRHTDLSDLLEPLPTCEAEADLLDGRPCCCLADNVSGTHAGACCPDCGADKQVDRPLRNGAE